MSSKIYIMHADSFNAVENNNLYNDERGAAEILATTITTV